MEQWERRVDPAGGVGLPGGIGGHLYVLTKDGTVMVDRDVDRIDLGNILKYAYWRSVGVPKSEAIVGEIGSAGVKRIVITARTGTVGETGGLDLPDSTDPDELERWLGAPPRRLCDPPLL